MIANSLNRAKEMSGQAYISNETHNRLTFSSNTRQNTALILLYLYSLGNRILVEPAFIRNDRCTQQIIMDIHITHILLSLGSGQQSIICVSTLTLGPHTILELGALVKLSIQPFNCTVKPLGFVIPPIGKIGRAHV